MKEVPRRVAAIEWSRWEPTERATLVFVVHDDRVLLIRKKRGLGAGKVNGPGGRIEPGESAADCAAREIAEELCVEPVGLRCLGELSFQFIDGYGIHVSVFRASDCIGQATETEEAVPLWTDVAAIPYDEMWEDDRIWLPMLLREERFRGEFIFDVDAMLDYRLECLGTRVSDS